MNPGRVLFGFVLVGLGGLYLLDGADVLDAGSTIGEWWPLAIVVLGVLYAASEGRLGPASVVLMGGGLVLLGVTSGLFGSDAWRLVWPAAIVLVGLWIMLGLGRHGHTRMPAKEEINSLAVFGSARVGSSSKSFRRGSATAVFGGVTVDLTEAEPDARGARLGVTAILGGVDVIVPHGWLVEMRGLPLLGGWDDTTDRTNLPSDGPRLDITALVVLGGVEVKHARRWTR